MAEFGNRDYIEMFGYFSNLTYPDKLAFYNAHFGIIPFAFPDFDTEISWYNNITQLALLTENFYNEKPVKFISEKTFVVNDRTVKFTVQPASPAQRIEYNRFIISVFLEQGHSMKMKFENELMISDKPIAFLTSKINFLISVQEWMKFSLDPFKLKINLRDQFLQILFNGLNFHTTGKPIVIQKRRKFVELYLFSYGLFLAEQLAKFTLLLTEKQKTYLNLSIK